MTFSKMFDLSGKVVAITGAGSGIGKEAAIQFAQFGASVVLLDKSERALKASAYKVESSLNSDAQCLSAVLDVTDQNDCYSQAATILNQFGKIDVLVNSAGISLLHSAVEISLEQWKNVFDVNLNGTFYMSRAVYPSMAKNRGGSIINMGSMSGTIINQPQYAASYMASKGAVHQLTKALAVEWASENIRVNALAPGYVATDMTLSMRNKPALFNKWLEATPMKRCAETSEVVALILFLGSEASSFMTGSIVAVDGGYTCL